MWAVITRVLSTVSFIAALGTLVLGVLSYWHGLPGNTLWIDGDETKPRLRLAVIRGAAHVVYSEPYPGKEPLYDLDLGAVYLRRTSISHVLARGVGVQWWALFPLLMILPIIAYIRGPMRRRRRRRLGLCIACGYSLVGLTEPRCPECGRGFAPSDAPAQRAALA